jgi:phosphoribosylglycinamide formyltransferase-1
LAAPQNLIVDLADERFDHRQTHHLLEALGTYAGITPSRYTRVPDQVLAWLDAMFGGWWSSLIAAGSAWVASDQAGLLGVAGFDARGPAVAHVERDAGTGIFGPFGFMKRAHPDLQTALLHGAFFALRERGYARAIIPAVEDDRQIAFYEREAGARRMAIDAGANRRFRVVVLASGAGSNFEAVTNGARDGSLPIDVISLVVNRAGAGAVPLAEALGIPVRSLIWDREGETREVFDRRVEDAVDADAPDLVLLLGWMHVLGAGFVQRFPQTLNLHPAYLPLEPAADTVTFPDGTVSEVLRGPRALDDAIAAGSRWAGASVHRLGAEVDRGEVLVRAPLGLNPGQSREALAERLHSLERRIVADAVRRWAAERA